MTWVTRAIAEKRRFLLGLSRNSMYVAVLLFLVFSAPRLFSEPVATIVNNGDSANRIDLVILSEGFTAGELADWPTIVDGGVAEFFLNEPFKEYQNYFNVHRIDVVSNESGADHPELGIYKDTAFDATYNCSGIQRLICIDNTKVATVLNNSLLPDQMDIVIVIVNDTEYGGSGGQYAVASLHDDSLELVLHELGHSFGLLADEYTDTPPPCIDTVEPPEPNVTMQTDRNVIKWNHGGGPPEGWIEFSTPIPTVSTAPGVPGLYEGARYCATGLYRATYDSKMRTLYQPYEQINEEQFIKRFYNLVSPIDSTAPAEPILSFQQGDNGVFQVSVPSPLSLPLAATWYVDSIVSGSGLEFTLDTTGLSLGSHTVEVEVHDPTTRVRYDPANVLKDNRLWYVDITEADSDGDGIVDSADNCTQVPNADQRDTNGDGYGNVCDPDLNNDALVNFGDLAALKAVFAQAVVTDGDNPVANADFNGDGYVNFGDLAIMKSLFAKPPGPSGLAP